MTDLSENIEDDNENGFPDLEIFQVKFLGITRIDAAKSEQATSSAIKNIISTAKGECLTHILSNLLFIENKCIPFFFVCFIASGKKLQRLKLSICPKGIETFDMVTGVTLHRVSIYRISYCSADAAHNNVFAFIAGRVNSTNEMCNNDTDELTCYAFLCAKRKIAYNLTVTVARNFERAFDIWKKSEQYSIENLNTNTLHMKSNERNYNDNLIQNDAHSKSILIDFNSDTTNTITPIERQRKILQTTWVSFDDEPLLNDDDNIDGMQPMHGKIFENNLWDMNIKCS